MNSPACIAVVFFMRIYATASITLQYQANNNTTILRNEINGLFKTITTDTINSSMTVLALYGVAYTQHSSILSCHSCPYIWLLYFFCLVILCMYYCSYGQNAYTSTIIYTINRVLATTTSSTIIVVLSWTQKYIVYMYQYIVYDLF